jgi:hypothetical protein
MSKKKNKNPSAAAKLADGRGRLKHAVAGLAPGCANMGDLLDVLNMVKDEIECTTDYFQLVRQNLEAAADFMETACDKALKMADVYTAMGIENAIEALLLQTYCAVDDAVQKIVDDSTEETDDDPIIDPYSGMATADEAEEAYYETLYNGEQAGSWTPAKTQGVPSHNPGHKFKQTWYQDTHGKWQEGPMPEVAKQLTLPLKAETTRKPEPVYSNRLVVVMDDFSPVEA